MTYQIFVEQTDEQSYTATPLLFPDCVAVGQTRDEALERIREALGARLERGEIVSVEVDVPEHPLLKFAGMFKDDPNYEEFLAEIEAYRREVDARDRDDADLSA